MLLAASPLLVLAALPASVLGATYFLSDDLTGSQFLSAFTHQTIPDPTHGRVNYVSQTTALAKNLTYSNGDTLILRTDYTTVLNANGPGRDSFRLQSNKQYTKHASVWNIRHMPQGCGTWPAIWEVGSNWPNNGEIDVLEGINDRGRNQATLHTTSGCSMPALRNQSGTIAGTDCNEYGPTGGCGVQAPRASSYGPSFNAVGGGWYAMERTDTYIKVWHWQRNDADIPTDIRYGSLFIDTSSWGLPFADFPNTNCNMTTHFGPQNIIINLTLCGDWAGPQYGYSGCPGDCVSRVNQNPSAFRDAYFDIAWLKIYQ
ncbi:laminarinase [Ganoderma leucocontextum]|nr:laminarinase [Ganoderma leucocontextum]